MAIVNAGQLGVYEEIPKDLLELGRGRPAESKARRDRAVGRVCRNRATTRQGGRQSRCLREGPVEARLSHALVKGIVDYIDEDVEEARQQYDKPLKIIEGR